MKGPPMGAAAAAHGSLSSAEILSQPSCWEECLRWLDRSQELQRMVEAFPRELPWLFIGCGSSYYAALAAAESWKHITRGRAKAVPASELLLFPDSVVRADEPCVAVLISRSGRTSEVLSVADLLSSKKNCRRLAITCTEGQPLEQKAELTLRMLPAAERSTVMTRSFTSMLLALQYAAATLAGHEEMKKELMKLPDLSKTAVKTAAAKISSFVQSHSFEDYVFLGQGPLYGIACESSLKVTEMSCSYAQVYHALEFRHGPKSIVGPQTLVGFLLSESGYAAECKVLTEMKGLGATTVAVVNHADDVVRASADLLITLDLPLSEYALLALNAVPGQLLGMHTAFKKKLNPDRPRHLQQVVVLES